MPTRERKGTGRRPFQVGNGQTGNGGAGKAQDRDSGRAEAIRRETRQAVQRQPGAVVSMALAVIVFALGCIQLLSTVHVYVTNLNELNANKATEARLIAQKADLENDIARWDDKAYVVAQARDRLGFVFPGEKSVRVLHPEAVTGSDGADGSQQSKDGQTTTSTLPWYKELIYSFKEADEKPLDEDTVGTVPKGSSSTTDGGASSTDGTQDGTAGTDGTQSTTDTQDTTQDTGDAQQ